MAVGNIPLEKLYVLADSGTSTVKGALYNSAGSRIGDFSIDVGATNPVKFKTALDTQWQDGAASAIVKISAKTYFFALEEGDALPLAASVKDRDLGHVGGTEGIGLGAVSQ